MRVIVACEFSGVVRDAFIARGHDAVSCDILPTEKPGPHILGDIREVDLSQFDLMVAHPPCTYLSNSGVCHLHTKEGRWELMEEGAKFFKHLLEADVEKIAIENPIMHKYAKVIIGKDYNQRIQPWMFGHPETKSTCLWLKNLPYLEMTKDARPEMSGKPRSEVQRMHYLPPSKDRAKIRSVTYSGIAEAMARYWG
jgi:hypothetical protein